MAAPKTIKLKNFSDVNEEIVSTAVAITPGMLLERTSANLVQAHGTAGGNIVPMFACEDELQGKGITDNYVASDPIQVWFPGRGDWVYAILANGQDVSIGDMLESDGNGYLQKHAADVSDAPNVTNQIVGVALDAVDTSGDSSAESSESPLGVAKRIRVQIV
jgi:hypothetical protein